MDATNSRKKSPRSSRKSETQTVSVGNAPPQTTPQNAADGPANDPYDERSIDLVARVRAAREAAQRKMDAFGDPADYTVRKIYPALSNSPTETVNTAPATPAADSRQQSFPFQADAPAVNGFDPKGKD